MAEGSFKEKYEEVQCAGLGKIYREQELAKGIGKGPSTDVPRERNNRAAFSTISTAVGFMLLRELAGGVKGFVFLTDPCLFSTLLLVIVLSRSTSFGAYSFSCPWRLAMVW